MKRELYILTSFLASFLFVISGLIFLKSDSSFIVSEQTYEILNSPSNSIYEMLLSYFFGAYSFLIPIVLYLGIATCILLLYLMYQSKPWSKYFVLGSILLSFSPSFIYYTLNLSEGVFILFLSLCLWLCLEKKQTIISSIVAILLSFSSLEYVLVVSLMLLYLLRKSKVEVYSLFGAIILISVIKHIWYPSVNFISVQNVLPVLSSFIFEFGNYTGVSIMLLGTSLVAFFYLFFKKYFYSLSIYVVTVLLSIFTQNPFLFNILIIVFSTIVFSIFLRMNWHFYFFKISSYVIVILLFSVTLIAFTQAYLQDSPSGDDLVLYNSLSNFNIGKVAYIDSKTQQLTYFSGISSFPNTLEGKKVFSQILYSTDIEFTRDLLYENNISHVLITPELEQLYFDNEMRGLLVNINDESYFRLIYQTDNYSLYVVD